MWSILVAYDEKSLRDFLAIMLEEEGCQVVTASSVEKATKLIRENDFDLILTYIRMGRSNGLDDLDAARNALPNASVVMMIAETTVTAMKNVAYVCTSNPFKTEDIQQIVKNVLEKYKLSEENRLLKTALNDHFQISNVIGEFESIHNIFDLVEKTAQSRATDFITGECGNGKELIAKAIHFNGIRKKHSFVSINCREMLENLFESKLFGYENGAFISADSMRLGLMV
jgi:DNA-binding NtrC family response regulator